MTTVKIACRYKFVFALCIKFNILLTLRFRFFALKTWFLEYKNFTYGKPVNNLKAVGHYTQMVWATSHKIGCGLAHCPGGPWGHFYNYVCHYCPG